MSNNRIKIPINDDDDDDHNDDDDHHNDDDTDNDTIMLCPDFAKEDIREARQLFSIIISRFITDNNNNTRSIKLIEVIQTLQEKYAIIKSEKYVNIFQRTLTLWLIDSNGLKITIINKQPKINTQRFNNQSPKEIAFEGIIIIIINIIITNQY